MQKNPEDKEPNDFPNPEEVRDLLLLMGLGLVAWQTLEEEHYLLFRKLVHHPTEQIASVLYHGIPSFESKRVLVDRLMNANVVFPEHAIEWKKLNKRLGDAAGHRGGIAHFGLGFEIEFLKPLDKQKYQLRTPHLRPSLNDRLRSMRNKGYENRDYRLSAKHLGDYANEFNGLKSDLEVFRKKTDYCPYAACKISSIRSSAAPTVKSDTPFVSSR